MTDEPKSLLIEQTAIEMAGCFYDEARSRGIDCRPYKNARQYAKKNFERFIPVAVSKLTDILNGNYPDEMKQPIYEALLERANWEPTINGVKIPLGATLDDKLKQKVTGQDFIERFNPTGKPN